VQGDHGSETLQLLLDEGIASAWVHGHSTPCLDVVRAGPGGQTEVVPLGDVTFPGRGRQAREPVGGEADAAVPAGLPADEVDPHARWAFDLPVAGRDRLAAGCAIVTQKDGGTVSIVVNDPVHLTEFRNSDKDDLVRYLNDKDIYERTLRIPHPYTEASADEWFDIVAKTTRQQGRPVSWAVRRPSACTTACTNLVGGVHH
jgi:hypothetical protein